ncbi:hypothetical protein GCM10027040_00750 [Halomonas shantousis]
MKVNKQKGFTLVELMVALVVGLTITLGAGKVFLVGWHNFRQTEALGDKQAILTFVTDALLRDIRRAKSVSYDNEKRALKLEIIRHDDNICSDDLFLYYRLGKEIKGEGWSFDYGEQCGNGYSINWSPVIVGLSSNGFPEPEELKKGVWKIVLRLQTSAGNGQDIEEFSFHAVNRTLAVTRGSDSSNY